MSAIRPSTEQIKLPGAGQLLVIAAAAVAAWLLWSESRNRGWIPGLARPQANSNNSNTRAPVKPAEPVSIPPLIADLSNEVNPDVRREALLKLASVGPAAAEAIDAIRERLNDEEAGVRYAAVLAITRVSQNPVVFLPELRARLDDPHSGVQDVACDMLATMGPPATGLAIELLDRESSAIRSRALPILRRIVRPETFPEISAAIEKLCQDPDAQVRSEAQALLIDWGMCDQAGIRSLLRAGHKIPGVRSSSIPDRDSRDLALRAITWLGPAAADLVPDLVALLTEYPELEITLTRTEGKRQIPYRTLAPDVAAILRCLSALKTTARPAAPYLLECLARLQPQQQLTVIATLIDICREQDGLLPYLTSPISEADCKEPISACCNRAYLVGRLLARVDAAEARRRVSLLIPVLTVPNKPTDQVALQALHGLAAEAEEAVPFLISQIDRGGGWAYGAIQTLGEIGPAAAPAVPTLVAILERANAEGNIARHVVTFEALGKIGPEAAGAVPVLLKLLDDEKHEMAVQHAGGKSAHYVYIVQALGKIAIDSPQVQSAIRQRLASELAVDRAVAMHALAGASTDLPRVLTELIEILKNETVGYARAHAAMTIGVIAGDRGPAIAPLTEALGDSDPDVRKSAAIALGSLGPASKSVLPALRRALLEARCGVPSPPTPIPAGRPSVLSRDNQELNSQLPLVQALLKAIAEIERDFVPH